MNPVVALLVVLMGVLLAVHLLIHRRFPRFSAAARIGFVLMGMVFLFLVSLGPIGGQRNAKESAMMQTCRTLALAMFQYANDNNNAYPDGSSSTEVFQKLLDGNYVSDPALFYAPLPGKRPAQRGDKLKPENVCYDVTAGATLSIDNDLPLVFLTGYRIEYRPDGDAVSLERPFPRTGSAGWFGHPELVEGLPVAYVSNNAWFKTVPGGVPGQTDTQGFGIVPKIIPATFEAHGKAYRQLTPDGSLKP